MLRGEFGGIGIVVIVVVVGGDVVGVYGCLGGGGKGGRVICGEDVERSVVGRGFGSWMIVGG